MSLINNMLKDLEKREMVTNPIAHHGLMNAPDEGFDFFSPAKLFIAAILIPILIFSLFFIFSNQKHPIAVADVLTVNSTQTHLSPGLSADDTNWLKLANVTGITMQVKENMTEITFMLDHSALYKLTTDGTGEQFSLTIDHSQLITELPPVTNLNSAIQKITSQVIGDSTKFNVALFPGATLKSVNLNDQDKNAELIVSIEYQANPIAAQNHPTKNVVKSQAMQSILSEQYQVALSAAQNGDYPLAMNDLSSIVKLDPTYNDARVSLIALMLDQNKLAQSKHIIDEGLNISPDYPPFIELKARVLTIEGKVSEALALLQSVSPPISENPEYHAFIAALYERTNNNLLSMNIYRQVLSIDPHNGNWWFGLGVSLDKLGQSKEAINAYTKAMTEGHLNVDSNIYLRNRLQALQELS